MKTILSAIVALCFLSISGPAFAQDSCEVALPVQYQQQRLCDQKREPVVKASVSSQGSDKCGAVAVSPKYNPRAWGAQSDMDDCTTALQDALDDCNEHLARKGGSGSCKGEATVGWAAAITCGTRKKVSLYSWVVDRASAAEAATDALARITSKSPSRCPFQVVAHGNISGRTIRENQWIAEVDCMGRRASATVRGAAPALNAALYKVASGAKGNQCQVLSLTMQ
jgi:hypothetical protein